MAKKKTKKSKKGKKAKSKEPTAKNNEELDIEGDGTQLGISKKKKVKKAKLTKEEKAAAKLAKKLEEFITNDKLYMIFLQKIDHWMISNSSRVETLFKNFDHESDGIVPIEVFRAGLHDMQCPVTDLEIHALCKKLDPEGSGLIEYCGFERGIHDRIIKDSDGSDDDDDDDKLIPEDYSPDLYLNKDKSNKNAFSDPFHQNYPRYIDLSMRLATFDSVSKHPGHFTAPVRSHMSIGTLVKVIAEIAKVTSGELHVYDDKSCDIEHRLSPCMTLEELGWHGGPLRSPQPGTLYYDYIIEFSDCPLLNCDHYFGLEKRPMNPVLTAYPKRERKRILVADSD